MCVRACVRARVGAKRGCEHLGTHAHASSKHPALTQTHASLPAQDEGASASGHKVRGDLALIAQAICVCVRERDRERVCAYVCIYISGHKKRGDLALVAQATRDGLCKDGLLVAPDAEHQ